MGKEQVWRALLRVSGVSGLVVCVGVPGGESDGSLGYLWGFGERLGLERVLGAWVICGGRERNEERGTLRGMENIYIGGRGRGKKTPSGDGKQWPARQGKSRVME